jgi:hypothetical protein
MEHGPRRDLWTQLWESRQARLLWSVSVLVLAIGHLAVPRGAPGRTAEPPRMARAESDYHEDLADISNLPRLSLDARPIADTIRDPGEGSIDEENES